MERSTMLLVGKPSISMGHGFHGYVSHNQRVGLSELWQWLEMIKTPVVLRFFKRRSFFWYDQEAVITVVDNSFVMLYN